jgi:cytochrome c-type biogenesis protein CcmF
MPWLLATAFLHSLIVQERRGMLRFWNVILITAAYHMCLLGTWITRSGILQGPHTFAESTIGKPLIVYIGLSFLFYIRYVWFQRDRLRPARQIEYVTSKEGSMLLNNFLMALAMIVVLVGVFSPLLPLDCRLDAGGFACDKIEWKQSAYNKIMVPIGLLTLFLMGASPLLSWRKSAWAVWRKTLRIPILAGVLGALLFALTYGFLFTRAAGADHSSWGPGLIAEIFSILTVGIGAFVIVGLAQEYVQGVRSRMLRFGENVVLAFVRLILRNKRRYGGYLMHLSIVFLFIGYSGGTFKKTDKFEFHYYKMQWPGQYGDDVVRYSSPDKAYLENYEIEAGDLYLRPVFKQNADRSNPVHFTISQEAHFHVQHGTSSRNKVARPEGVTPYAFANRPQQPFARLLKTVTGYVLDGRMTTERHFHPQIDPTSGSVARSRDSRARHTPTSEPDIRSTWNEDIYIQLGAIQSADRGPNPDLNHAYEFYYYQTDRGPEAYAALFPPAIVATLEVWVNPLVKFVWLGSLLFFLCGLLLLVPFGERDLA